MRQAGRYLPEYRELRSRAANFLNFCYTPDLAVEATLQPLRRYAMDAAILFSDILVVADALGCRVEFREGEGPVLEAVRSVDQVTALRPEGVIPHLEPVFETVRRLSRELPESTALIGFAGAPWTVAVYMVEGRGGTDCSTARNWAWQDTDGFGRLMGVLVDATAEYLIEQVKNGAEAVQVFDSWAGVLAETQFRQWVIAPTREIVRRVNAACPGIPVIGFPRGAGAHYAAYVAETGVDGVGLDAAVPASWAAEALQPRCAVQGNLDNQLLRAGGPALDDEITRILKTLASGPFIFNLGHGILPDTPPDHVGRLAEHIHGWPGG